MGLRRNTPLACRCAPGAQVGGRPSVAFSCASSLFSVKVLLPSNINKDATNAQYAITNSTRYRISMESFIYIYIYIYKQGATGPRKPLKKLFRGTSSICETTRGLGVEKTLRSSGQSLSETHCMLFCRDRIALFDFSLWP